MNDEALEEALDASRRSKRGHRRTAEPIGPLVHRELKCKYVTLLIRWDEYIAANPGGDSCRGSVSSIDPSRRGCRRRCQAHAAGERLSSIMLSTACRSSSIG